MTPSKRRLPLIARQPDVGAGNRSVIPSFMTLAEGPLPADDVVGHFNCSAAGSGAERSANDDFERLLFTGESLKHQFVGRQGAEVRWADTTGIGFGDVT